MDEIYCSLNVLVFVSPSGYSFSKSDKVGGNDKAPGKIPGVLTRGNGSSAGRLIQWIIRVVDLPPVWPSPDAVSGWPFCLKMG